MSRLMAAVRTYGSPGHGGKMASGWAEALEGRGYSVHWVDVFQPGALDKIKECGLFFCTTSHDSPRDLRYLSPFLETVEQAGCLVYPDFYSRWHFDDKIAQAWLFEALDIPSPTSWLFFNKTSAIDFIDRAEWPLVFKLAAGAGSQNVRLVSNRREAKKLVNKMFGRGMRVYPFAPRLHKAIQSGRQRSMSMADLPRLCRTFFRLFSKSVSCSNRDRGYVFFQEFVPDNVCDYRVTVVGGRAFTFLRAVRDGDFRASGSGMIRHLESHEIDIEMIKLAFHVRDRLKGQCIAMDFVRDPRSGAYKVLEVSPSFVPDAVALCKGYYTQDLVWVSGQFSPQEFMVADVLARLSA